MQLNVASVASGQILPAAFAATRGVRAGANPPGALSRATGTVRRQDLPNGGGPRMTVAPVCLADSATFLKSTGPLSPGTLALR